MDKQSRKYELIGESEVMRCLRAMVRKVAQWDAKVLIIGPSGSGKEVVARTLHAWSPRSSGPFIAFNCANVSKDLLESRLFGHERGAFTGAVAKTDGVFGAGERGTVFLDEIGELPIAVQGLLLRVLETGCRQRVGGIEEIPCNVRLVTATNRNLVTMVKNGAFRCDLYQRINVVRISAPALKDHKEDIPEIAGRWISCRAPGRVLTPEQTSALMEYDYSDGNVRELLNLLDRAISLGVSNFKALIDEHIAANSIPADEEVDELDLVIQRHVRRVYDRYDGNATLAAARLGISRNTLRKYLVRKK